MGCAISGDMTTRTDDRVYEAELYRLQGDILSAQQPAEARDMYQRGVAIAASQSARHWQLRGLLRMLALDTDTHEEDNTARRLESLLGTFTEGFKSPEYVEAKRTLTRLSRP